MLITGRRALSSFLLTLSQSRNWTSPSPYQMPTEPQPRIIDDYLLSLLYVVICDARTYFDICRREESLVFE